MLIVGLVAASAFVAPGLAPPPPLPRAALDHIRCGGGYTRQEQNLLDSLQGVALRVAGGGALGVAGGSAAHAAIDDWIGSMTIDPLLNLFDLLLGGAGGLLLGVLWAQRAALLDSGVIREYVRGAIGALVTEEEDAKAGEAALKTIRDGFETLAYRGDWPLRLAFFLSGLGDEPAVARLVEEAQAEQRSSSKPLSDIIALAFESTLEARIGDATLLIVGLLLLLGGGVNGVVYLGGAALGSVFGG